MSLPPVVSPAEWQTARDELLAEEKAATRALDALAAKRRRLPMVRFDKPYVFEGPDGSASLADLFEGRRQLVVYNFMLWPDSDEICGGCASFTDNVAHLAHLHARDTTFALVSRVPRATDRGGPGALRLDGALVLVAGQRLQLRRRRELRPRRDVRLERLPARRRRRLSHVLHRRRAASTGCGWTSTCSTSRRSAARRRGRTRPRVGRSRRRWRGCGCATSTKARPSPEWTASPRSVWRDSTTCRGSRSSCAPRCSSSSPAATTSARRRARRSTSRASTSSLSRTGRTSCTRPAGRSSRAAAGAGATSCSPARAMCLATTACSTRRPSPRASARCSCGATGRGGAWTRDPRVLRARGAGGGLLAARARRDAAGRAALPGLRLSRGAPQRHDDARRRRARGRAHGAGDRRWGCAGLDLSTPPRGGAVRPRRTR